MSFEESKAWADRYLDQQFAILKSCINDLDFNKARRHITTLQVAPEYDDQNLETDAIMFGQLRIALRVRSGHSSDFNDIAIRSYRPSGAATELHKIQRGFGDYYLYCWSTDNETITEWILIDLDEFREHMDECLSIYNHFNDDGTAFNTYSIPRLIETGCCVDSFLNVLV